MTFEGKQEAPQKKRGLLQKILKRTRDSVESVHGVFYFTEKAGGEVYIRAEDIGGRVSELVDVSPNSDT